MTLGFIIMDTVDFKTHEKQKMTGEQCEIHPDMVRAKNFLLEETR